MVSVSARRVVAPDNGSTETVSFCSRELGPRRDHQRKLFYAEKWEEPNREARVV